MFGGWVGMDHICIILNWVSTSDQMDGVCYLSIMIIFKYSLYVESTKLMIGINSCHHGLFENVCHKCMLGFLHLEVCIYTSLSIYMHTHTLTHMYIYMHLYIVRRMCVLNMYIEEH